MEDKALINNLYQLKEYGSRRLLTEFPEINWNNKKIRETGSTDSQKVRERQTEARALYIIGLLKRT